jgi:hypothetical protein
MTSSRINLPKIARTLTSLLFAVVGPAIFNAPSAYAREGSPLPITQRWVRTSGWEKNLVQGNPNLGHFTWIPITSYPHDMGMVYGPGPTPYKRTTRRQHFYVKPVHVPTIIQQARSSQEVNQYRQPRSPIYTKPIHIPTAIGNSPRHTGTGTQISFKTGRQADPSVNAALRAPHDEVVNGKRLSNRQDRALAGRLNPYQSEESVSGRLNVGPQTAVYPEVYGKLQTSNAYGNLTSQQVYGRISSSRVRRF